MKSVAVLLAFSIFVALGTEEGDLELVRQAQKAVSPIAGEVALSSLRQPVKVARDQWGVAHIYAANERDLFFA
ncbi:MAG TPA: penicillin acylase family protein, partial [Terriglobales bacterium]|nr:penicillin acylase family protein [Terriglobales bacterium]